MNQIMKKRHPNHRLVKIHRNYTVNEVAILFDRHKNTVRNWVKSGLAVIDEKRPMLFHGQDLVAFFKNRREKNRHSCQPEELFCVKCRRPRIPEDYMAEFVHVTEQFGRLRGICPDCGFTMNKNVSHKNLGDIAAVIDITFPKKQQQLIKMSKTTVNC